MVRAWFTHHVTQNKAMAQQINNLISCETELSHTKKRVALLSSLLAAQSENPEITVQGTDKEIDDVALFNQIDEYIKGNKLFLQPEIDREALIKLVHTNKINSAFGTRQYPYDFQRLYQQPTFGIFHLFNEELSLLYHRSHLRRIGF